MRKEQGLRKKRVEGRGGKRRRDKEGGRKRKRGKESRKVGERKEEGRGGKKEEKGSGVKLIDWEERLRGLRREGKGREKIKEDGMEGREKRK